MTHWNESILYRKYCPEDSKKYKTISVGGLRAEQFAIKIDRFYREKHQISEGIKIATEKNQNFFLLTKLILL